MSNLLVLFNHTLTHEQEKEARDKFLAQEFIYPDNKVQKIWSEIPSSDKCLKDYLSDAITWLKEKSYKNDYVLIQGDFGATYILIQYAFKLGLVPIYSTTKRDVMEENMEDGSIKISRNFKHIMFRKYEVV